MEVVEHSNNPFFREIMDAIQARQLHPEAIKALCVRNYSSLSSGQVEQIKIAFIGYKQEKV
jgi:hypothetical protein